MLFSRPNKMLFSRTNKMLFSRPNKMLFFSQLVSNLPGNQRTEKETREEHGHLNTVQLI